MADCGVSHHLSRRTADRGNDRVLFSSQGCKFQETNLEVFNGDENHGKEEHPEGCSGIYTSPPCFDDYGDEEVNNSDYLWVSKVLNGFAIQGGGPLKGIDFLLGSNHGLTERITEVDPVTEGDSMVVGGCVTRGDGSQIILPISMRIHSKKVDLIFNLNFKFVEIITSDKINRGIVGFCANNFRIRRTFFYGHLLKSSTFFCVLVVIKLMLAKRLCLPIWRDEFEGMKVSDKHHYRNYGMVNKKRKSAKINNKANGLIRVLKQLNDNAHKTRGRVFFEDGENDAGDDPINNPDPEWDPD
ncbi:hypothetical protein E3N88_34613 [Mikania micrantha]|uniref:Uncharacterized protein n=1 Tax=Mikania micrantha TaxID=192012 RepID=A0A5N6M1A4_9ASTR|nr:hypothetical protein E3N88_34613 [Mikania micrantha]